MYMSIPVLKSLYPPFSSTCQMKCGESFHLSTTSLCKALVKQADRSEPGPSVLLEENFHVNRVDRIEHPDFRVRLLALLPC